jgi:hypothetical protein
MITTHIKEWYLRLATLQRAYYFVRAQGEVPFAVLRPYNYLRLLKDGDGNDQAS